MKQPFYKSPQVHKWGLFACLLGSLGFNLSMNPEHTLFARNSHMNVSNQSSFLLESMGPPSVASAGSTVAVYDTAPAAPVAAPAPAVAAPTTATVEVKTQSFEIMTAKESYNVDVMDVNGTTIATVKPMTDAEGKSITCESGVCNRRHVLNSPFSDIAAIRAELRTLVMSDSPAAAAPAIPAKPGQALEVNLEAYAAVCEDKYADDDLKLLKCHKGQLIEISKALKNHKDQQDQVTEYFKDYIQSGLRSGLNANISAGPFSEEQDKRDLARDLVDELMSKLRSKNGERVKGLIVKMNAEATLKQAELAKNKILAASQSIQADPMNSQMYLNQLRMNSDTLLQIANDSSSDYGLFQSSTGGSEALAKQVEDIYTPMGTLFQTLQTKFFNQVRQYPLGAAQALNQIQFNSGLNTSPVVTNPGTGTTPNGIYEARNSNRSYDNSALLPDFTGTGTSMIPGGVNNGVLQQGSCPAGQVATGNVNAPCAFQGQQVQQAGMPTTNNGIPAPRSATQLRGQGIYN